MDIRSRSLGYIYKGNYGTAKVRPIRADEDGVVTCVVYEDMGSDLEPGDELFTTEATLRKET